MLQPLIEHPLAQHKLTYLRDEHCNHSRFRQLMREIGMLLASEVLRNWEQREAEVTTPIKSKVKNAFVLADRVVVVPILRAGLVLAEGAQDILGTAYVGHIGLARREGDYMNVFPYLIALPDPGSGLALPEERLFILMDSVIGTGATACKAIEILLRAGVRRDLIRFATIVVTPEGIKQLSKDYADIPVYALACDDGLDEDNHIVPGLGDTANRLFGI